MKGKTSFKSDFPFKTEDSPSLSPKAPESPLDSQNFQSQKLSEFLITQNNLVKHITDINKNIKLKFLEIKSEIARLLPENQSLGVKEIIPTKQCLIDVFFPEIKSFDFTISLVEEILSPVCKGKYFTFQVKINNEKNLLIPIEERIQVRLSIYSAENPPKPISKNMNGKSFIKGHTTSIMTYDDKVKTHTGSFKIQLNEVSSHFMNGWVFLVVDAQKPSDFLETIGFNIKPLVIKELVIKAKETTCKRWREKDTRNNHKIEDEFMQQND